MLKRDVCKHQTDSGDHPAACGMGAGIRWSERESIHSSASTGVRRDSIMCQCTYLRSAGVKSYLQCQFLNVAGGGLPSVANATKLVWPYSG